MSQVLRLDSKAPFEGLSDKIALIRRYYRESLMHPEVRAFAEKSSVDERGQVSLLALFSNMKSHLKYMADPVGHELIKAPWVMVSEINQKGWSAGDCDDFASLAYSVLNSLGKQSRLMVGWYGAKNPEHIWVRVDGALGGIDFDLVAPKMGVTKGPLAGAKSYV